MEQDRLKNICTCLVLLALFIQHFVKFCSSEDIKHTLIKVFEFSWEFLGSLIIM